MHVLLAMHDMSGVGGTERSLEILRAGLAARGHRVTLLHGGPARGGSAEELVLASLSDDAPFFNDAVYRSERRELMAYCREESVDLAHVHGFLRPAALRQLQRACPVVLSLHTQTCPNGARYQWATQRACERPIGIGCFTKGYTTFGCGHLGNGEPYGLPGFARGAARARQRLRSAARSAALIVPSAYLRDRLGKDGVPTEHISVVHPPVAWAFAAVPLPAAPPAVDRRATSRLPLVTFAGRLVSPKGPEVAVRASAAVATPHVLAIAGEGTLRGRLEALAEELGLAERVLFLGALDHQELSALFRRSAVVVAPSLMPETFGLVGPEAVAAGVPAVVTGAGGAPEWIALAGDMVRQVPRGDVLALAHAVEHFLTAPRSDSQATAVRELLSSDVHVEKTLEAYARAAQNWPLRTDLGVDIAVARQP